MYSLSGRPPDVRSTPNSGPIADILRSRRWANTDREFTFADYPPDADYHPDEPGASQGGRALFADNFDGRALGPWFDKLRRARIAEFGGMPFALSPGEFRDSRLHRQVE
jgi:hypothetical protein